MTAASPPPLLRFLGRQPYRATEQAMRDFTAARGPETPDEIWLVEHDPVYTQGLTGKAEHVLDARSSTCGAWASTSRSTSTAWSTAC